MMILLFVLVSAVVVGVIAAVFGAALWMAGVAIIGALVAGTTLAMWVSARSRSEVT